MRIRETALVTESQRVFVALWPTPEVRARLADVACAVAAHLPEARVMQSGNLHLTLAFIGSLDVRTIGELAAHLGELRVDPFTWILDRIGVFRRARVLWAGGEPSAALERLAADARALLDHLRVPFDSKPFAGHVTLIRNVARLPGVPPTIEPAIEWVCERATLVRSETLGRGVAYVPVTPT